MKTENDVVTKWREAVIEEGNKIINGVTDNKEVLKALNASYIRSKYLEIKDNKLQIMDKVFTTNKIIR